MQNVYVLVGFDCDRPRGEYIETSAGAKMADEKLHSLEYLSEKLESLQIPRTYFICGQFLESMISKFGVNTMRALFEGKADLVEIADHSYSHNIFKKITARPDKVPISTDGIVREYKHNTELFSNIFKSDMTSRGLRTPLGHYQGLTGENELITRLKEAGVLYISSDLRQEDDSICPVLVTDNGSIRQPYYYSAGLLEIPSHGWHDTAFGGLSKTPLKSTPPSDYPEIVEFYRSLFQQAVDLSNAKNIDVYIGLVMHPYNIWQYDSPRTLFDDLKKISVQIGVEFRRYDYAYYADLGNH